jgi:dethiobiotin synthetase
MQIFITGTDTNVGKTIISAWLALHFKAFYWKPIQTGAELGDTDSQIVGGLLNVDGSKIIPEKYIFKPPVSPHLAAALQGQRIDLGDFILPQIEGEHLIVEGAGGILTPVNESDTMLQLVRKLKLPAIIVARSSLGTINHTCLTIEVLRNAGVPVLGVIMNGPKNEENKTAIEHYGKVTVLDEVESFEQLDYAALKSRVPSQKLMSVIHEFSNVR